MNIYDYLDQIYEDLNENDWDVVESKYRELALKCAGEKVTNRITHINLRDYQKSLYEKLLEAVDIGETSSAQAIWFEYDIENNWKGRFLICPEYYPESEEDDDWASEWESEVEAMTLGEFAAIYREFGGYNDEDSHVATTLYLITRLVCAFGRCVDGLTNNHLAICIGFPEQDPLWRIVEKKES
ncbi:hypothetical protein JW926_02260 [Candidatus Sumerlaeota bacterium]|nr:hypothetical protein [Candidatus Sumerlaeota bacterium]